MSLASLKPRSYRRKRVPVSSSVVIVLLVPAGASLTAVTFTVMVFGVRIQIDTAIRRLPPSSCTWKVTEARVARALALGAELNTKLPLLSVKASEILN